ncbi:DUF4258 domain-containing protein [Bradyrhizobium sp.]|uniref:DUF4258 domain-containing protein n=1 Tax=Bradyrhizobium sp. TaxID=376 RepID=UPI0025C4EA8D|nr:DUF4258 domain-containing protein [Bradyrhizobium sp.]
MSEILHRVQALVARDEYLISRHGFRELLADDILTEDVLTGVAHAVVVESYPDSRKEPAVLVLQHDRESRPVHVMCGIPKTEGTPAILVTAYRPAAELWSEDFMKRKQR